MNAVLLSGSPRKNGNTELLLSKCAEKFTNAGVSVHQFLCSKLSVKPCRACGACKKTMNGKCSIQDDDFGTVFTRLCAADIIVVGSPVYFGSATPNLMSILDRAGYVARASGNLFSRKIGGPIVVARRAGQNFTYAQLLFWYMINEMIVPGSSYWNIAFGREPNEVNDDQEGIATIARFTDNLIWLSEKLSGGDSEIKTTDNPGKSAT